MLIFSGVACLGPTPQPGCRVGKESLVLGIPLLKMFQNPGGDEPASWVGDGSNACRKSSERLRKDIELEVLNKNSNTCISGGQTSSDLLSNPCFDSNFA